MFICGADLVDTCGMPVRSPHGVERDRDEAWTRRDARDIAIILATAAGALLALFAIVYGLAVLYLLIFGFHIPID